MMLVCLPSAKPASTADEDERCFMAGGEYRVILTPTDPQRPVAVYPFRLERRNGVLGFVTGLTLISGFVLASVW